MFVCLKSSNIERNTCRSVSNFNIKCRYLGTTICIKNSDLDLKRQMRKMYVNANVLLRKLSKCSINVKCYLFKTYCSNFYCAPMWFDCTKTALKKLKVAYNNTTTV